MVKPVITQTVPSVAPHISMLLDRLKSAELPGKTA